MNDLAPRYTLDDAIALHGRTLDVLSDDERSTLLYYMRNGRKFGISVHMDNTANPAELGQAESYIEAVRIMGRAVTKISVVRSLQPVTVAGLRDAANE